MTSCTAEEPQGGVGESPRAITLTAYTAQPLAARAAASQPLAARAAASLPLTTRADSAILADKVIPYGGSIGVYAYYHDNSTWAADDAAEPRRTVPNFMFNQQATNAGIDAPFAYAPLKYWPNESEDKVSFIAYYPYTEPAAALGAPASPATTGITPLLGQSGTGLPTFRFHVQEDVKKQVDFMVSDLLHDLPNGTAAVSPSEADDREAITVTDRVRFLFRHATAKVEFRIVVDDDIRDALSYFTLHSLALTNIYDEALLTPSFRVGEGTALAWSAHAHPHDYPCKTTEAYLLLPQALRDDAHLTIRYDLAFKSEGTTYEYDADGHPVAVEEYIYRDRTADVPLNTLRLSATDTPLTEWLPNHHYVYTIRLGAHRIDFTGQVVDWGQSLPLGPIELKE